MISSTVNSNGVLITNNNMGIYYAYKERIELKMPKVVQSYEELLNMFSEKNIKGKGAKPRH